MHSTSPLGTHYEEANCVRDRRRVDGLLLSTGAGAQLRGINATYTSFDYALVNSFYNVGTSSVGTSGANFGIAFWPNARAICLNSLLDNCSNTSRGGLGDPTSQRGGLYFLAGTETLMNRAGGFTTGFSFFYVSLTEPGSFSVWDGLNGMGNLLASLNLNTNAGTCDVRHGVFCPFSEAGVSFAGTARSVSFAGVANQIVFDDVTFGSSRPGTVVPEPATVALTATGLFAIAAAARRRRQTA